ncbi:MAG: GntR family transcriptional regulator [Deltaproteobacteria bacterium]|nr:GntR family transcriptional regulator [Deltaproteobacteria bacterium]
MQDLCAAIRGEIVSRKFPPGMRLSQRLGERWNVSRTPIREALRHLESEGFVHSTANRGFVVTSLTLRDLEQVYTLMIHLDSLAGRLATPRIAQDSEKLAGLRSLCEEMRFLGKQRDADGYARANEEFHALIFHASENAWLIRILEVIHGHANRSILKAFHTSCRIEKPTQEHAKILKWLEKGDARGAEKAIAAHFTNGLADLRKELGIGEPPPTAAGQVVALPAERKIRQTP